MIKNILIHYIKNYYDLEKFPLEMGKLIFPSQKVLAENKAIFVRSTRCLYRSY